MKNYEAKEVVIKANGLKLHGYGANDLIKTTLAKISKNWGNVPQDLFDNEATFYSLEYPDDSTEGHACKKLKDNR